MESKRIAYAALDIGTSRIKLGVYCPVISNNIILINNYRNELVYGNAGEVRAIYKVVREKAFAMFKQLGTFLQTNHITTVQIGICGHVSSLIEWNRTTGMPAEDAFPIWLDTTCHERLHEYEAVMGNGKSKDIIGTFLPSGTNWLFTKLLHRRQSGLPAESVFLQVSDAIFFELTGTYRTHFSSQISMVNLRNGNYAPELLAHLQLDASALPLINHDPLTVLQPLKDLFNLPAETLVFPGMADLYTSLYGLRLQDREGFMLANTSEQAGAFYRNQPRNLDNFLSISFDPGFINYGSTNTGGNVIHWFVDTVLRRKITTEILSDLTQKAAGIPPEETPIILPYLQGERAPLWNSRLTASILELNSSHTDAHLFRAILESIAFARRQCFEQLGMETMDVIKIAGGSSNNDLWNVIRATVINKELAIADEKELSMAGIIFYIMETSGSVAEKPAIQFTVIAPDAKQVNVYNQKYAKFIHYQKLIS